MAKPSVTPAQRKRRILRDTLLLAVVLVLLALRTDFPILTANQALAATQARYLFGPGEVITTLDHSQSRLVSWLAARPQDRLGLYDRYYILRQGDWYAWCGINRHILLFWQTGELGAVENYPDLPLVPLIVSNWHNGIVLIISNDPEIARVEIAFPALTETNNSYTLFSASETQKTENCFLVSYSNASIISGLHAEDLQVRGYDADGTLLYQSPIPENWAKVGIHVTE